MRVGVNLGDLMVEGGDLLGDGINIAACSDGLAQPGNLRMDLDCAAFLSALRGA
jgi:class 3 adenylate cyclase